MILKKILFTWVRIISSFIHVQHYFAAFELLEKGEILEMPAEQPLTEDVAWTCFRDVLHGLEYCKREKVVMVDNICDNCSTLPEGDTQGYQAKQSPACR